MAGRYLLIDADRARRHGRGVARPRPADRRLRWRRRCWRGTTPALLLRFVHEQSRAGPSTRTCSPRSAGPADGRRRRDRHGPGPRRLAARPAGRPRARCPRPTSRSSSTSCSRRSWRSTPPGSCTATSSPPTCCSTPPARAAAPAGRRLRRRRDLGRVAAGERSGPLGTDGYLAPERQAGAPPHPSQDLYAAGVLAAELLDRLRAGDRMPTGPLGALDARAHRADPGRRAPTAAAALAASCARLPASDGRAGRLPAPAVRSCPTGSAPARRWAVRRVERWLSRRRCTIGAHVDQTDPIAEAKARDAPLVQFFLGDPQGYKGPEFRYAGGADGLKADAEAAGHRPLRPRALPRQRRHDQQPDPDPEPQAAPAARRRRRRDRRQGPDRARRPRQRRRRSRRRASTTGARRSRPPTSSCPLLIENTAGGDNAMTRYLDRIAGVWDAISAAERFRHGRVLPRHLPRPRRRQRAGDGRRRRPARSPAASTSCTATTAATTSTPAPTGTPTSGQGKIDPDLLAAVVRDAGAPGRLRDPGRRRRARRRHRLAARAALSRGQRRSAAERLAASHVRASWSRRG